MQELPVFIGGFRSGTTLLINLLGMHPRITPWFETKELSEALRWLHVLREPSQADFETGYCLPAEPRGFTARAVEARMHWLMRDTLARISGEQASGKAQHERYPLGNDFVLYSQQEADAALVAWRRGAGDGSEPDAVAQATGVLIRTLASRQRQLHRGGRWINKTPEITRFAAELRSALGPCRIIYLVRDGMEVVASGLKLGWGNVETLAFNWKGLLERTRKAMQQHPEHYLELRYEQLVREPVATLERVLEFCGEQQLAADIVAAFSEKFGEKAFAAVRLQHRGGFDAEQLRIFNAVAGDMQAALGYPLLHT
jgi:hypothetical protein